MIKGLKKYIWVVEWVCVALLLSLAIFSVINEQIYLYIFGLLFVIFGLMRVVPLIKTTKSKLVKWFIGIETLLDVTGGIFLLLTAVFNWSSIKDSSVIGYLIGSIIYLRGFIYFLGTTVKNEPTEFVPFLVHIAFITIATIVITKGGFNADLLAWILFILILIICIVFILRGYKDFKLYRGHLLLKQEARKSKQEDKTDSTTDEVKLPTDISIEKDEINA